MRISEECRHDFAAHAMRPFYWWISTLRSFDGEEGENIDTPRSARRSKIREKNCRSVQRPAEVPCLVWPMICAANVVQLQTCSSLSHGIRTSERGHVGRLQPPVVQSERLNFTSGGIDGRLAHLHSGRPNLEQNFGAQLRVPYSNRDNNRSDSSKNIYSIIKKFGILKRDGNTFFGKVFVRPLLFQQLLIDAFTCAHI